MRKSNKYTHLTPLTCTANTLCHVDYGIPISAYKSTDYRTCTGTYHRFMPPLPQDFDCRVKGNVNLKLVKSEPKQREEYYKTVYNQNYNVKHRDGDISGYVPRPTKYDNVNYLRNVQEKFFSNPPPPMDPATTITKSEYYTKYPDLNSREVFPPDPHAYCQIKALGRDETPPIPPEQPGYYRLMDPYMTTSRISYIPFTLSQQDGIARKDIITFYDATNVPRAGKGYGPRNGRAVEPIYKSPNFDMYDTTIFKTKSQGRLLPRSMARVPNFGTSSEYQRNYNMQTQYNSYSTIYARLEDWDESLPNGSPWQNLAPPAMYCTEYCHTGTGWPPRAVVDPKKPKKIFERDIELCRNEYKTPDIVPEKTTVVPCVCPLDACPCEA